MLQIPCSLNSYISGGLQVSIGLCNESHYGESVGHPSVRSGEHIGISRVTNKRIQPRKVSAVFHHLLYHKIYYPRLKFLVSCVTRIRSTFKQLKESVFVMRDRPKMNRNRRSASLCLNEFLSRSFLRSVTFRD